MGNQQSTLQEDGAATIRLQKRQKQPTKLTKPRTNTSTNNLLLNGSTASRQASKIELPLPPLNKRASTVTVLTVDGDDSSRPKSAKAPETEKKAKRRSLFRSKTAQQAETKEWGVVDEKPTLDEQWLAPLHRYSSFGTLSYETLGDLKVTNDLYVQFFYMFW
jgi:hypothetical protein